MAPERLGEAIPPAGTSPGWGFARARCAGGEVPWGQSVGWARLSELLGGDRWERGHRAALGAVREVGMDP